MQTIRKKNTKTKLKQVNQINLNHYSKKFLFLILKTLATKSILSERKTLLNEQLNNISQLVQFSVIFRQYPN